MARHNIKWHPPTHPGLKLNFDGSVFPNLQVAAGFVVRNATGHLVLAMAKKLGTMEILVAEAMTLRDGLLALPNSENQHLIVEGDYKILIDALNGKVCCSLENQIPSPSYPIIKF